MPTKKGVCPVCGCCCHGKPAPVPCSGCGCSCGSRRGAATDGYASSEDPVYDPDTWLFLPEDDDTDEGDVNDKDEGGSSEVDKGKGKVEDEEGSSGDVKGKREVSGGPGDDDDNSGDLDDKDEGNGKEEENAEMGARDSDYSAVSKEEQQGIDIAFALVALKEVGITDWHLNRIDESKKKKNN